MKKGEITCSACSHAFAVPANARAAICPRCGQALPVFVGSIEPIDVPTPKREESLQEAPSVQLARLKLKKQAKPRPLPPPPPPPATPPPEPAPTFAPRADPPRPDLPPMPDTDTRESTGIDLPPRPGDVKTIPVESEPDLAATGVDLPQRPPSDEVYPAEPGLEPRGTGVDLPPRPGDPDNVQLIPIETDELPDDERDTETYQQQPLLAGEADLGDLAGGVDLDEETEQMDHLPWVDGGAMTSPDLPRRAPGTKIDTGYFEEGQRPSVPSTGKDEVELPPPPPVPPAPPLPPEPPRAPTLVQWGSDELHSDLVQDDSQASVPTVTEEAPSLASSLPPPPPSLASSLPPAKRTSRPTSERVKVLDRAISEVIEGDSGAEAPTGNYPPDVGRLPPGPPAAAPPADPAPSRGTAPPPAHGRALVPPPPPDMFPGDDAPGPLPSGGSLVPPPPMELEDDLEPATVPALPPQAPEQLGPIHLGDSGIMVVVPNTPIQEVQAGAHDGERQPQLVPAAAGVAGELNELAPISRLPPRSVPVGHGTARKAEEKAPMPTWLIYTLIGVAAAGVLAVAGVVLALRFLGD